MPTKTMFLPPGGGLDRLHLATTESRLPGHGEITVQIHACSLKYHDYVVVSGVSPPSEPRIPLSDAAGIVTAGGGGVTDLAIGDHVVSLFFPEWHDGPPGPREGDFARVPGDGLDGYAREEVTVPATAFTRAPTGYSHVAAATLPCAELTGGLGVDHVIEVGGPGTMEQSIIASRVGGRIALIGILTGIGGQMSFIKALAKHLRIQGLIVGSRRHQLEMIRAIDASGLQPVVDSIHPLDGLAGAFRHQESHRHFGKICREF